MLPSINARIQASVWAGWLLWAVLAILSAWILSVPSAATEAHQQGPRQFHLIPFFAPFHSVVLHFPIGFIVILGILELHMLRGRDPEWRRVIHLLVSLTAFSAVVVATLGLLRGSRGGYDEAILQAHFLSGTLVATLAVIALTIHAGLALGNSSGFRLAAYRAVLAALSFLVIYAGHQGGSLTHGSRYLVRNAPDFVREYWQTSTTEGIEARSLDAARKHYLTEVLPILDEKCKKCHGANAQMAGYRLDVEDVAFAGGNSGRKAIVPGDPAASNLVRAVLLPESHPKLMPPAGLSPLSPDELLTVITWIRDGAPYVPDAQAVIPLVE